LSFLSAFGDADPIVPMDEVEAIQRAFASRPNPDIGVYQGAGHNFAMPEKDGHHPMAAKESRERAPLCFRSM
jgi:dienelactone hydrolase